MIEVMSHYTFNSGLIRQSLKSDVDGQIYDRLGWLVNTGFHDVPTKPKFCLKSHRADRYFMATLYQHADIYLPLLSMAVAPDEAAADEAWPLIESHYHNVAETPENCNQDWSASRRPPAPWCANVIIKVPECNALNWLADFTRCIAWSYMHSKSKVES